MTINYTPSGVCSSRIIIEVEGGTVESVKFVGGCSGNSQGIGALVKGMKVEDVIEKLNGIKCGGRSSSCPAQLARALRENPE